MRKETLLEYVAKIRERIAADSSKEQPQSALNKAEELGKPVEPSTVTDLTRQSFNEGQFHGFAAGQEAVLKDLEKLAEILG